MNRISKYEEHAVECLKLANSSNEKERRDLVQMAEDWQALADKVRQREANPQEQKPAPIFSTPKSPEHSDTSVRMKRPLVKKARTPVQTVVRKSR
jgi:hypothetical protein